MVLSNLNNNMDVESRTMATMGDTLGGSGARWAMGRGARDTRSLESQEPQAFPWVGVSVRFLLGTFPGTETSCSVSHQPPKAS